jgi:hypothetical protein
MRLIEQIYKEVEKRNGVSLRSLCNDSGVNYQTVRRALWYNKGITEETLIKLQDSLGMVFILVEKKVLK